MVKAWNAEMLKIGKVKELKSWKDEKLIIGKVKKFKCCIVE